MRDRAISAIDVMPVSRSARISWDESTRLSLIVNIPKSFPSIRCCQGEQFGALHFNGQYPVCSPVFPHFRLGIIKAVCRKYITNMDFETSIDPELQAR
jgi:hypothetical protein